MPSDAHSVPTGHATAAEPPPAQKKPLPQTVPTEKPEPHHLPVGHTAVGADRPAVKQYEPASHTVKVEAPGGQYCLVVHCVAAGVAVDEPAGQW
jgi:hypothetical protein